MIELNSMRSSRGLGGFVGCFFYTLRMKMIKKIVPHTQLCYSEIQIDLFLALLKLLTFFLRLW